MGGRILSERLSVYLRTDHNIAIRRGMGCTGMSCWIWAGSLEVGTATAEALRLDVLDSATSTRGACRKAVVARREATRRAIAWT